MLAAFAALTAVVVARWSPLVDLDGCVMRPMDRVTHSHPAWHRFWLDVSDVLEPNVLRGLAAVVVALLLVHRQVRPALALAVTMIGAAALSTVLKLAVDRHRPVPPFVNAVAGGASYPSGHALTAVAAAIGLLDVALVIGVLGRRARWAVLAVAVLLVGLVSVSRLFLAVHFLSDVIGGLLVGAAWALAAGLLATPWPRSGRDRLAFGRDIR